MEQGTIAYTPEFRRIAEAGIRRGYNRTLTAEFLSKLDPDGMHVLTFSLPHEHIAGERVEPHWRTIWMVKAEGQDEAVENVAMDMSEGDFRSLKRLEKVNGVWRERSPSYGCSELAFNEMKRRAVRGPYGTEEGDIWLGIGSDVQEQLDADGKGLHLVHEVVNRDDTLQEVLYVTDSEEILARARAGHERWVAEQALQN